MPIESNCPDREVSYDTPFPGFLKLPPYRKTLQDGILPLVLRALAYFQMTGQVLDGPQNAVIDVVNSFEVCVIVRVIED